MIECWPWPALRLRKVGLVLVSVLISINGRSGLAQNPTWEGTVLVTRTRSLVRFDANSQSSGHRSGVAPAIAVSRATGFGAIRLEALVIKKGFERMQPTYHWTYLEFPILLEVRSRADSGAVHAAGHAGLAPSFALSCSISYSPSRAKCRESDGRETGAVPQVQRRWVPRVVRGRGRTPFDAQGDSR